MSGKLNMKSIIAIAAVTVLTAIAIIGTVVFLKDKGTSEATEIASENGVNGSGTETINVQENGVKVFADIVLNHRLGADGTEEVYAIEDLPSDRNVDISKPFPIQAWTKYEFPGRRGKYSDFKWNWTHFHGVDWDEFQKRSSIYKFYGKHWDKDVDKENGNFDYLMGADIDLNNVDVTEELKKWGLWYAQFTNIDGFRMDAVKHMRASFMESWLNYVRNNTNRALPAVGEYWSTSLENLKNYIKETNASLSLFDVPLHYNLYEAANSSGYYDFARIFESTLVKEWRKL